MNGFLALAVLLLAGPVVAAEAWETCSYAPDGKVSGEVKCRPAWPPAPLIHDEHIPPGVSSSSPIAVSGSLPPPKACLDGWVMVRVGSAFGPAVMKCAAVGDLKDPQ